MKVKIIKFQETGEEYVCKKDSGNTEGGSVGGYETLDVRSIFGGQQERVAAGTKDVPELQNGVDFSCRKHPFVPLR